MIAGHRAPWAALAIALLLGRTAALAQDLDASSPDAPQRDLPRLCRALILEQDGRMTECAVARRTAGEGLRLAVLRVRRLEGNSPEELVLAARGRGGWRRVATIGPPVYSGHGMIGAIELLDVRVVRLGGSGPVAVRAVARSWQGEPGPDGCLRGPIEVHETVSVRDPAGWRSCYVQTAGGPERVEPSPFEETPPRCEAAATPTWRARLTVDASEVALTLEEGAAPEGLRDTLGARPLAEALGPAR